MNKHNTDVLFLTSSINYPFYRKRLIAFFKLGVKFSVYGFYRQLGYPATDIPFPYIELANIKAKNYFLRFLQFLLAIPKLRGAVKNEGVRVVYVFGLDMAVLATFALLLMRNKPKIVAEVHDIREIMVKTGLAGNLARRIEKYIVQRLELLIVTSEAYIENYYKKMLGLQKFDWVLLENKLRKDEIESAYVRPGKSRNNAIVIGYFGSLRCPHAWHVLKDIASRSNGKIKIYIRGYPKGLENFESDVNAIEHMDYAGPYLDPDELADVYNRVDIVWTAGFHQKSSFVWARSCRYYNALAFSKPIIAQIGTEDCRFIRQYDTGTCIDLINKEETIKTVMALGREDVMSWKENIDKLPESHYLYTTEHIDLLKRLGLKNEL